MPNEAKMHSIRSKTTSLKEAAELFGRCPDDKKRARIAVMRETAQDIVRLLSEVESELPAA